MDQQGYQGWTNYETWNTALWINNEYNLYKAAWGKAFKMVANVPADDLERVTWQYAMWLNAHFRDVARLDLSKRQRQLVDWYEIAESFIVEAYDQVRRDNG